MTCYSILRFLVGCVMLWQSAFLLTVFVVPLFDELSVTALAVFSAIIVASAVAAFECLGGRDGG